MVMGAIEELSDALSNEIIRLETIFFVTITINSAFVLNSIDLQLNITIDNGNCKITKERLFQGFAWDSLPNAIKKWIDMEIGTMPKGLCVEVKW